MKYELKKISVAYFSGSVAGLMNGLFLWLIGKTGITRLLGVALAPSLNWDLFFDRLVWGGLWGLLIVPFLRQPRRDLIKLGLLLSLIPTMNVLFFVFPFVFKKGWLGLELGKLTPLIALGANMVWGYFLSVIADYVRD